MANTIYKLSMVGIAAIIIFGVVVAFQGYNDDIYPLDRMRGHLDGIVGSADPAIIQQHLVAIKQDIAPIMVKLEGNQPMPYNPIWIFPTESTNFQRINSDVDTMIVGLEKIAAVPKDSSAYHTGMTDINNRAILIKENIVDATPYMYVNISNMIFVSIWVAAILGIFAALKRKKDQLKTYDETQGV